MPILTVLSDQATQPTTAPTTLLTAASATPSALPAKGTAFLDETGLNPLPPGVLVTIYPYGVAQTAANAIYAAYTQLGGTIAFTPQAAVQYTATFYGSLGPLTPQSFYGSALAGVQTTVWVSGYRSPFLSQGGYTQEQMGLWPPGRFSDAALSPNGVAYALAYTFAYLLAYFDIETQQTLASDRIQTCIAGQIDSWVYDFFGQYLLRFPGESDAIFIGRVLRMFGPRCTIPAILQVVQEFYIATALQTQQAQMENLGYESAGGFDIRGGFDVVVPPTPLADLIPNVTVWDAQSNPTLAQEYNIAPPQFVVQIDLDQSKGWFLDYSYLDFSTYLTGGGAVSVSSSAPDARLGALVNLVKACGTQPMYAVAS